MKIERTKNAARNIVFGAIARAYQVIIPFLMRTAIKARLNHQFLNLDQGFLEKLIDDTVYEMVYGDEKEMI